MENLLEIAPEGLQGKYFVTKEEAEILKRVLNRFELDFYHFADLDTIGSFTHDDFIKYLPNVVLSLSQMNQKPKWLSDWVDNIPTTIETLMAIQAGANNILTLAHILNLAEKQEIN